MRTPRPYLAALFIAFAILGCGEPPSPQQAVSSKPDPRLEALQKDNQRLQGELVKARQNIAQQTKNLEMCRSAAKEATPPPTVPTPTPSTPAPHGKEDVLCDAHLIIEPTDGETTEVIRSRLRSWGLRRLQVVRRDPNDPIQVWFQGPKGAAEAAQSALVQEDILRVHWLHQGGLAPFTPALHMEKFKALFPDRFARIRLETQGQNTPFVSSTDPKDLSVFADQLLHLAPNLAVVAERIPRKRASLWRSQTIVASPVVEHTDLSKAFASEDEDGAILRLQLNDTGRRKLKESSTAHTGQKLAFVMNSAIQSTLLVLAPVHTGSAELSIGPGLGGLPPIQEARRLAAILNSPPYPDTVPTVRIAGVECSTDSNSIDEL